MKGLAIGSSTGGPRHPRRERGRWTLALAGAIVLFTPATVLAHLGLRDSTPADGAHVATAPRELRLAFTQAVTAAVARLRLIGPSGTEVPLSALRQPADSGQLILADVRGPLEAGAYRLEWQVVGRDGHPVRGKIEYVIAPGATGLDDPAGAATPAGGGATGVAAATSGHDRRHDPTALPSGEPFGSESAGYVAIRALQYATLLAVIGALAFAFVVLRLLRRTPTDSGIVAAMRSRAAGLGLWAAAALLVTALLRLYAQSLAMHGPAEALDVSLAVAMLRTTVWGWGWLLQLVGAIVATLGFALARRDRAGGWMLAALAGLALAVTPALSGHAAATPDSAVLAVVADALHVVGAAGWLGSLLLVLTVGIPTALQLGGDDRSGVVARLVNAFSPTALLFAGLATLTGIFAVWLHVGFSSAIWTSDYGRTLLVKLGILSLVLVTGAYNWRRVSPTLGDDRGTKRIQRSATVELTIAVLVVVVTAVLVATPPPRDMTDVAAGTAPASAPQD